MKKIVALLLSVVMLVCFASCGNDGKKPNEDSSDNVNSASAISQVKDLAGLKGFKIAAQAGTFHADALNQIEGANPDLTYPEFADLLTALNSGAVDGYIAEEPTALAEALQDPTLSYIPLENNKTGFTATAADVGIAIGLKTGSALRDKINTILAEISEETKAELMKQIVNLAAGKEVTEFALKSEAPATTNGVLRVGMECAYRPFNWNSPDQSLGCVPISSEGQEGLYANGYDVQVAQYVANKLGMKLEIYALGWDSLIPALDAGTIDAIVAGMSPTAEREEQVDFTTTYYESNLVIIIKK